jgi:hypothetical protein
MLAAVIVCAFLPWAASGSRSRNSYELLQSARRLDALSAELPRAGAVAWFLVPAITGIAVLAAATRRGLLVAGLAAAAGLVAVAYALYVRTLPLRPEVGTTATLVVGGLVLTAAAATALRERNNR